METLTEFRLAATQLPGWAFALCPDPGMQRKYALNRHLRRRCAKLARQGRLSVTDVPPMLAPALVHFARSRAYA